MPDREKVIEALEHCIRKTEPRCAGCPYFCECAKELLAVERDALALLREQEPEPILYRDNRFTGLPVATCPRCGRFARQFHSERPGEETKFCPWCGKAVKWDDVEER